MESIKHFSHSKHPLILKKLGEKEEVEFVCYGCQEPITEKESYYACEEEGCGFYLHKKCADLPTEINIPIHKHPLTLFASSPYSKGSTCTCNICRRSGWKWFTYHCSLCRFDIDVICSSLLQEGNNILQHEGHPHPLTFHPRTSLFHCDACDTEDKDLSYFCTTCHFRIHKNCASAPKSITVAHHEDPLLLSYSLPSQHRNFKQFCNICQKKVCPSYWVYYCDNCRYFNHLKCATAATATCSECNFFLHRFCADLPEYFQCPCDPEHSVQVKIKEYCYLLSQCSFCSRLCNGFVCYCASCKLRFDIGCACNLIPSRIEHDSHRHPLVFRSQLPACEGEEKLVCNACGYYGANRQTYSCKACNFNLCIKCVNYRGSVMHEYDRHSIPLTFPPIKNHPSDFICEICEEDINPRFWMYHCQHCNQSFHTSCLSPFDWYSNVKFGGTVNIGDIHQHPLTFVRKCSSEYASLCDRCGKDNNGIPILECAPCGFKLCRSCARQFEA